MSRIGVSVVRLVAALYVLAWLASCEGYAAAGEEEGDEDVFARLRSVGSA